MAPLAWGTHGPTEVRSPRSAPSRPLALLCLSLCVGVGVGPLVRTAVWPGIFPLCALALVATLSGRRRVAFLALASSALLLGAAAAPLAPQAWSGVETGPCARALREAGLPPPTEETTSLLQVEGRVEELLRRERNRATVRVDRGRPVAGEELLPGGAWVSFEAPVLLEFGAPATFLPLPGDRIRAVVRLDDPPPTTPASTRAHGVRQRRGVACVGSMVGDRAAALEAGAGWLPRVEGARRRLAHLARTTLPDPVARGLVPALMVGDRAAVPEPVQEDFAASGLAHLLSVSGLHLSLTVLGSYGIARRLLQGTVGHLVDAHRLAAGLVIPLAPIYAAFTGAQPPVLRAAVGTGLLLLARALARGADGWTTLALAAAGIVAWDPSALFEPSFQLSFAACLGLIGLAPALLSRLPGLRGKKGLGRRALGALVGSFVTTLAATLATLPFIAHYFHRVSLVSLLANVLVVPLGLLSTAACALCGAIGLFHEGAFVALLPWAALPVGWLARSAAWFAAWPWATVALPVPTPWEWGCIVCCLAALPLALRRPTWGLPASLACALAFPAPRLLPQGPPPLVVEFLPIGQGDATLLRLPTGEAVLIDTGGDLRGERDRARGTILPLLAERGIIRLHALVISHLHPDHVGSAPTLLRSLPVGEVWFTGRALEGRWGAPIAEVIQARGIPLRRLHAGADPISIGDVSFHPLGPPSRDSLGDEPVFGDNDASLILLVRHGAVRLLFAGDVEREGEEALVASGAPLRAELLKAPHHGSRTSSTQAFLEQVKPDHVVFCVGWRNQFNFPAEEVVERYRRLGVAMHRTDRGAVRFVSDGATLRGPGARPRLEPGSSEAGALLQQGEQPPVVSPKRREHHRPPHRADQIDRHAGQERADLHPINPVPPALHLTKEGPGGDPLLRAEADLRGEVPREQHREEQGHQHRAQVGPPADPLHPGQKEQHPAPHREPEDRGAAEERPRTGGGVLPLHGIQGAHGEIMTKAPGGRTPARGTTGRAWAAGGRPGPRTPGEAPGRRAPRREERPPQGPGAPFWIRRSGCARVRGWLASAGSRSCCCCSPSRVARSPCSGSLWRRAGRRCGSVATTSGSASSTGKVATSRSGEARCYFATTRGPSPSRTARAAPR